MGRVISLTTPDSAVVTTSYSGNAVTVTDQAGKARKSVSDALGRITSLYEDPLSLNYLTTVSAKKPTDKVRFIGPGGQAKEHKAGGIDYDVSFRENRPDGPMQLSFASKENFTRLDMDMDENCQNCGDKTARLAHIVDGGWHFVTGRGTNPEFIHGVLTARGINPSYTLKK